MQALDQSGGRVASSKPTPSAMLATAIRLDGAVTEPFRASSLLWVPALGNRFQLAESLLFLRMLGLTR